MPIYEYTCQACNKQFSARRAMKDADAAIPCPDCGAEKAKRGLSKFFAKNSSGSLSGAGGDSSCSSCSSSSCGSCGGH